MSIAAASSSGSTLWYLTRGTGTVALVLLSAVVVLGVLNVRRFSSPRLPRFVVDSVHRFLALLAVAFLAIHIVTAVLDPYAPIGWLDAIIPLHSAYRPLWLGLGALSFDLLLAIAATSLLRTRIGHRSWRAVHWFAYACWPIAVLHSFGTGSDARQLWFQLVAVICVLSVAGAVVARVSLSRSLSVSLRAVLATVSVAFVAGLAVWLPGGPLAHNWASRAGTPSADIK